MAENTPIVPPSTLAGAPPPPPVSSAPPLPPVPPAPPKPGESGKIQPKKETVRINLPPKPTASPTIKIPAPSAIHAAAPAAAATAAAKSAAPAAGGSSAVKTGAPTTAAAAPAVGTAKASASAAAPAAAPRPAAVVYNAGGLDMVDKILAIAAAVVALLVLVRVFMLTSS